MSYLKKILSVIFFPVVFITGSFCIQYVFVAIFNSSHILKFRNMYPDLNDIELVKTIEYRTALSNYLNNNALLITVIIFIIFGIFFYNTIRKMNIAKNNIKPLNILKNGIIHITDAYNINNMPLIVTIVTSGLLGPILEELLYRGIVYNKLLTFNSHKKACIITSIMFSIMHFPNIITMIYTFILSFIMIYLYDKYKTLHAPIIFHIAINTTILALIYSLVKDNIVINTLLLLISLFGTVSVLKLINWNSDKL